MFSLLRKKDNLSQSSKVSTSCPSISSPGTDEHSSNISHDSTGSSESEDESIPKASRSQQMFARKSIRRQRKREKEFEKKIKLNKITMDDYLSKQDQFKLWLTEEKHKCVENMKSPKTKAYFKAFVKLWNKRKLHQKYYRGTVSCETPPNPTGRQRFNFGSLADSPFPNTVSFPQTIDLSHEGSILSDSPFSTFGKSPGGHQIPINKTPGSGHDLLDLKRKAIFNNMGKESGDQPIISDYSTTSQSDDQSSHCTKSVSSSRSGSETSGSASDSPRSSKCRREKEENLYKVTVLSWTSKGELQVRPSSASPNLTDVPESPINPDILAKHITSSEYSSIDEHNMSMPYHEVDDAISDLHDPTYCVVRFPPDPTYSQPYNSLNLQSTAVKTGTRNDSVFLNEKQSTKEIISSLEDLYAVPIKKKKSSDKSETVSLTSNESTAQLDRKISGKSDGPMEMDKLSDIISSGSDFSITSGSSSDSLNKSSHLSVPRQDSLGNLKASSAPELSTILEGDVTRPVDKSYDEQVNFTNVTAMNVTGLQNSYMDQGNVNHSVNNSYVDMSQWKKWKKPPVKESSMNTTEAIEDVKMDQPNMEDWKMRKCGDFGVLSASTPDRRRNLSDPSKQSSCGENTVRNSSSVPGVETKSTKRTVSDPTSPGNFLQCGSKCFPRSSLPSPPPPPPLESYSTSGHAPCGDQKQKDPPTEVSLTTIEETPLSTTNVKSPYSESWPSPPPNLDETPETDLSMPKPGDEDWPTPPTPYDFCKDSVKEHRREPDTNWPTPPVLANSTTETPDSVFEDSKPWPAPPTPHDMTESTTGRIKNVSNVKGGNLESEDDEPPKLVTADYICHQKNMKESEEKVNKPPVFKLSEVQNIYDTAGYHANMKERSILIETDIINKSSNMENKQKPSKSQLDNCEQENRKVDQTEKCRKSSERQVSTTSIERFETDIDAVDSPQGGDENIQTKKRVILETVV